MADVLRDPAEVVRTYSRISAPYELWAKVVDRRVRRRMLALAQVMDGESVLDVGCGDGSLLEDLARSNPSGRTVGIDLADGMLARARQRVNRLQATRAEVRRSDVRQLAFEDASFDVVTCAYVLDILPEAEISQALNEIRRVLRSGGRVVVANVARAERRRHRLPELLYGSGLPLTSNCRPIDALPRLAAGGYIRPRREYVAQFLLPTELVVAMTTTER